MSEEVTYTWKGPPGVKWIRRPPIAVMFIIYFAPLVGGFALGLGIGSANRDQWPSGTYLPNELTDEQKHSFGVWRQATSPMEIRLQIIPRAEYDRDNPDSGAHTFLYRWPCQIVMPDGMEIEYTAPLAQAHWRYASDGDILAHEILHCIRGGWHEVYDETHPKSTRIIVSKP